MRVEVIDSTSNIDWHVGRCAGVCYGFKSDNPVELCRKVVERGHLSCLRHASATIHIKGISRVCSHQMVRHPHLSYLQRSQRYCDESDCRASCPNGMSDAMARVLDFAAKEYEQSLKDGVSIGDARYLLPAGVATEMIVTGNMQAWREFIDLRTRPSAQAEIRSVAITIFEQLKKIAPICMGEEGR